MLLTVTGCKTTAPVAAEDRSRIKEIVKDPGTTLVDVRIPEQYSEATAKNAVNIPLADIENHLDFFRKQKQVVIFCNRGRQADEAIEKLRKNGITANIYDGVTWKNVKAIQNERTE